MQRIVISRTDSIGDVMLTLPMCVWLKKKFPEATLIYLGKGYTKPVVDCFYVIDEFVDWNVLENSPTSQKAQAFKELHADAIIHVFPNKEIAAQAKKSRIPMRIGTSHRSFHLLTCTHRVNFSRKNSNLHEAQLNFELLRPFGLKTIPNLDELSEMTKAFEVSHIEIPTEIQKELDQNNKTVILHPKSQGSALEWPIESYFTLANRLVEKGYTVFFTGTKSEGDLFRDKLPLHENIVDLTGKMSLEQLIYFISQVKNLVACSTGPLHIAGFTGVRTIGLFSSRRPIHPGRWKALGPKVSILEFDPGCEKCKRKKHCSCIQDISVETVLAEIE